MASLALAAAVTVIVALPAAAHTTLVSMSPAVGSLTETAPTQVVLTFADPVQSVGDAVVVRDPAGGTVSRGSPVVLNATVTQALSPITVPGTYTVAYRVVAADGHPVEGQQTFSYKARSTPAPAPTSDTATSSIPSSTVYLLAVAAAAVVIAIIVMLMVRRQRSDSTTDGPPPSTRPLN